MTQIGLNFYRLYDKPEELYNHKELEDKGKFADIKRCLIDGGECELTARQEIAIKDDAELSFNYAVNCIKEPFELGERAILSSEFRTEYMRWKKKWASKWESSKDDFY